ncbi:MAG: hypothetical protein AB1601_12135 [Planctomycetota bacterium]
MPPDSSRPWPAGDTPRLSPDEYAAILAELDAEARSSARGDRRAYRRRRYRGRPVTIVLRQPGGSVGSLAVKPHDLGPGGLSFLHGTFVHTRSVCEVTLRTVDQRDVAVAGRVVRCRLIRGRVHEVGVAFYRPIDVRRFVPETGGSESDPTAHAAPPRFSGRVLCVDVAADPHELAELLRVMAGELGIDLEITHDREAAAATAARGDFDLVMVRIGAGGAGVIAALRAAGYAGPLVALDDQAVSDGEPVGELAAWTEGCDCIVSPPLTFDRLADLFDDYLARDWNAAADRPPLLSAHWAKVRMRPLILRFLSRLDAECRQLGALWQAGRAHDFGRACQRLIADAETYGYEAIAGLVHDAQSAAEGGDAAPAVAARLDELLALAAAARRARDEYGLLDPASESGVPGHVTNAASDEEPDAASKS